MTLREIQWGEAITLASPLHPGPHARNRKPNAIL